MVYNLKAAFGILALLFIQAYVAEGVACEFCKKNKPTTTTPPPCETTTCCPQRFQPSLPPIEIPPPRRCERIQLPRINLPELPQLPTLPSLPTIPRLDLNLPSLSCRRNLLPTFEERRTGCALNVPPSCESNPRPCTASVPSSYGSCDGPSDQIRHLRTNIPRRSSIISSLIDSHLPLTDIFRNDPDECYE